MCAVASAPGGSWAGQRPSVSDYVVMTTGPGRGDHRQMLLMSASLLMQRGPEATDAVRRAQCVMPTVSVGYLDKVLPITDPPSRALFLKGLRQSGLPA
jgi:hypothetical protein